MASPPVVGTAHTRYIQWFMGNCCTACSIPDVHLFTPTQGCDAQGQEGLFNWSTDIEHDELVYI